MSNGDTTYKEIHIALSGKGGVGKSTNFIFFAQYLRDYKEIPCENLIFLDTDQVNSSFYSFEDLEVNPLEVTDTSTNKIDERLWDSLPSTIISAPNNSIFIIDTGGSVFQSLKAYLDENGTIQLLAKYFKCFIHFSFSNGAEISNTLGDFQNLVMNLEGLTQTAEQEKTFGFTEPKKHPQEHPENINYVLWLNKKDGPIQYEGDDFFNIPLIKSLGSVLNKPKSMPQLRIVDLKNYDARLFFPDIKEMLNRKLTFRQTQEIVESPSNPFGDSPYGLPLMTRQRLAIVWNDICNELEFRGF